MTGYAVLLHRGDTVEIEAPRGAWTARVVSVEAG